MITPARRKGKEMFARQQRILIVDDEPDCLFILENILTRAGYLVDKALGGDAALRKLGQKRYDLVLTDLAMPGTSGLEVIAAVKSDPGFAHIPVLATTAHVWEAIADGAGAAGCDGFLNKPIHRKQVLSAVEEHLKNWRPRLRNRPFLGASGRAVTSTPNRHTELRPLCERPAFNGSPAPRLHGSS
jgi:CheY-like chemotaxis protein